MAAPVGRWRATYTPGAWIVLAGPTSLVVMQPASGKHSALIAQLWEAVLESASIVEVATRLAGHRIDTMPSFGAFFWAADGMRSLVRGDVTVVDVATDSVVASGEGIQTWTEAGLDGVTQVRIEMPTTGLTESFAPAGQTTLTLPLVVGAVRASTVLLDGSPSATVFSPQQESLGQDLLDQDLRDQDSGDRDSSGEPDELKAADAQADPDDDENLEEDSEDDQSDTLGLDPAEVDAADDEMLTGPMTEAFPGPLAEPDLDAELRERMEYGDTELMAPISELDSMENGDTQLMGPATPPPASAADVSSDSMIMAVVCQYGHASPQNATVCRICGTPIVPQGPQLVPRPTLALLRSSDGTTKEVDRVVLVGRAPAANASTARSPRLMTVPSPGHDISRTHVEVAPEGWQVVVTDLRSTNGTTLVQPGTSERTQLPPGEAVPVPLGSVMELGDGVSVLIDFPQ